MRVSRILLATVMFFTTVSFSSLAGKYQAEANDNPFLNGELNPKFEGELTALSGDIIQIVEGHKGRQLYKLNLNIPGIKPIWVTGMMPIAEGEIALNSRLIFSGFIATASGLDESGQLKRIIDSETLLLAVRVDSAD